MLLRGGSLGEVSPTRLYRQVSRSVPDLVEALYLAEEALYLAVGRLLKRFERVRPGKTRKKHPSARHTLCENVTYALS